MCFSLNQTVPELMKLASRGNTCQYVARLSPAPVSLDYTNLSNFFWPRKDLGKLPLLIASLSQQKATLCRQGTWGLEENLGLNSWLLVTAAADHSSLPHLFWLRSEKGSSHSLPLYIVYPLVCLTLDLTLIIYTATVFPRK